LLYWFFGLLFGRFFVGKFGGRGNQLSKGQTITPIKIQDLRFFGMNLKRLIERKKELQK
jgi:hypothetical protein